MSEAVGSTGQGDVGKVPANGILQFLSRGCGSATQPHINVARVSRKTLPRSLLSAAAQRFEALHLNILWAPPDSLATRPRRE